MAPDHGAHAVSESGSPNHDDVDEQKQHEKQPTQQSESCARIGAAEDSYKGREHRHESGGHRQAGPDRQRE
jgi:hypothetical protein